jgi:catechol-2,3-dioxygenase
MARFYRETLGWPVALSDAGPNASKDSRVVVTAGRTTIEFSPAKENSQPFYHFAFNIPHNKLDAAVKWMKSRAALVKRDNGEVVFHFPNWNAHAIYFLDPSGNIVEFIARHTLKNDAPGDFGVEDILYASEIGLVTADVRGTSKALINDVSVREYQTVSDSFAPIGDEHGLFIVVKQGRPWFASNSVAKVFPAEVVVRGGPKSMLAFNDEQFRVVALDSKEPPTK